MNVHDFSEWFSSLSPSGRITALALIYSNLTVGARQFFLPEWKGNEQRALEILHGLNELHHTLSNQLVEYATDGKYVWPLETLGKALMEIVNQYRLGKVLDSAIEFARTRVPPLNV